MSKHLASITPGPAAYNPPSTFGSKKLGGRQSSMTGKPRGHTTVTVTSLPGPGSHVQAVMRAPGVKYSMQGKNEYHCSSSSTTGSSSDSGPSPAQYFITRAPKSMGTAGPKYSMPGKQRDETLKISLQTPGPGKYEPLNAYNNAQAKVPALKQTGRARDNNSNSSNSSSANGVPGVGAYNLEAKFRTGGKGTTMYSMQGKPRGYEAVAKVAGPGPTTHVAPIVNPGPKYSIARKTTDFDTQYISSSNVQTMGMRHPVILMTAPSTVRVTVSEMKAIQERARTTTTNDRQSMVPVVSLM